MKNKVISGNCLQKLDSISDNSVELVVTDPPYGIDFQSSWRTESEQFDKLENDDKIDTTFIPKLEKVTKDNSAIYIFTRWDVYPEWYEAVKLSKFEIKNCIVWNRKIHGMGDLKSSYAPQHDFIIYATKGTVELNGKRPTDIISKQRVSPEELEHPTEKPVSLLSEVIKNSSDKGDVVLDPFAGSGSTLLAAQRHDRKYIGIEIKDEFLKLSKRRIKKSKEQKKITDLSGI